MLLRILAVRYRMVFAAIAGIIMMAAFVPATFAQEDPLGIERARGEAGTEDELILGERDLIDTIASLINLVLGLLGIIAVVIILIAGFKWMTAGGNEESVTEAKGRITQGVIGLAVILSAYAIANFAIEQLGSATRVRGIE